MATAADFRGVIVRNTYDEVSRTIAHAIGLAGDAAMSATSKQALALIDVFARDVAAAERKAFFEKLGDRAHHDIIKAYKRQKRGPSGYRADMRGKMRRYAGGRMLNALERQSNIFEATARGITFLPNVAQLDREAKQWYRLNFGAQPNFGRGPGRFDVSISNIFLFSLGFEQGPSEPFRIPRGFWIEGGVAVEAGAPGTSAYYPARAAKSKLGLNRGRTKEEQAENKFFGGRQQARGITAEHFLDAGLHRFTQDLRDPARDGIGLSGLYYKFYKRGLTTVRPTRPPSVDVARSRFRA